MKTLSILGDSISTFELTLPKGHISFYDSFNAGYTGIVTVDDTWWGRLIKNKKYRLLVNNSYSGSRVSRIPDWNWFPSGCSEERIKKLQKGDEKPDDIIVYLGTNDWGYGVPIVNELMSECGFDFAYDLMLTLIKEYYPQAKVYCCTLLPCFHVKYPELPPKLAPGGIHIEEYNQVIKRAAKKFGYKIIDLYKLPPYSSIDGAHPDYDGMYTLYQHILYFIDSEKYRNKDKICNN